MKQLLDVLAFFAAIYAGWAYGMPFGLFVWTNFLAGWGQPYYTLIWLCGGMAVFLLTYIPLSHVIRNGLPRIGAAVPTTTIRRRAIGLIANALLLAAVLAGLFSLYVYVCRLLLSLLWDIGVRPRHLEGMVMLGALFLFFCIRWRVYMSLYGRIRSLIGHVFSSAMRLLNIGQGGRGGSARFAGICTDWANRWVPGRILLGGSTYSPRDPVGIKDDRHMLTIAATASGKGRSAIIPNLLTWTGSAIVIDPKGTNAIVTAASRGSGGGRVKEGLGQAIYVFDPFGVTRAKPGVPPPIRINPLADIEPGSLTFYEDCDRVADSLVIPDKGDPHFDESARAVLRGLIAHVVVTIGPEAHLGHVRDMLTLEGGPPLKAMAANVRAGPLAREVAAQLMAASDREYGSIISTAIRHTGWLASEAMRHALSAAEFRFDELKEHPATLYAVLPPHYLETHARALRAIVNAGIGAATRGGRSKTPILFILDEFYSLGRMSTLTAAIANIRSYNVRLWPIVQNLSQLADLYGRNWTTFWANTGQVQVFATNDKETQEHIASVLGMTLVWDRNQDGKPVPVGRAQLRDAQEIAREVSRSGGRQIVFREGDDPLVLKRFHYDEAFPQEAFNPDPDHSATVLPLWKRIRLPWTPLPSPEYIKFLATLSAPAKVPPVREPVPESASPVGQSVEIKVKPEAKTPPLELVPIKARASKDRGIDGRQP